MRATFLGVRGSVPASGGDFVRYGGSTSAVAIGLDDEHPTVVLDAGTGLRRLTALLDGAPFRGDIVLTHLHWDHVQGIPFTRAVDHPESIVRLHVPVRDGGQDPARVLRAQMSPPSFPIGPEGLLGSWELVPLLPGPVDIGDQRLRVTSARVRHKGGPTYGFRVAGPDGASLGYLPDHLLAPGDADGAHLLRGVDVLLHDGQFVESEEALARSYGHTTVPLAKEFADRCAVGRLVVTHHHPDRTDAALDELAGEHPATPQGRPVCFASEGRSIVVHRRAPAS